MTEENVAETKISLSAALKLFAKIWPAWPKILTKVAAPSKHQTFARINPDTHRRELIGYGGANKSMNFAESYVTFTTRDDSLLGKKCMYVLWCA